MKIKLLISTVLVIYLFVIVNSCKSLQSQKDLVSYNFDIRPILSDKCFKCHGPDPAHRSANLRLDIADSAYAPLKETKGAFAIVPGYPEKSELYKRITTSDKKLVMPPVNEHLGLLTEKEVKLFKNWIEQGAKYEKHWAFIEPKKAPLPDVSDKNWVKNEIDYFILEKIDEVGLEPNPEADKERLLKRVSIDLTGLPPSVALMDKFLADESKNAYEKIVTELINTPQYGEKMAVHWLDVARYADSYGYQDDNIRTQWPWRDWLIHAFNKNIHFDDFLTYQLAGDMLPNANKEQILATAFLRNHKYSEEGGIINEEYRIQYLEDKTKTYSKGVLGITLECAQCHDHKYDPFSQKDYFSIMAFFNNTKEKGFEGDVSASKPAKTPIIELSNTEIKNIYKFINTLDTSKITVSVMKEDTFRKTFILGRGAYDQPTKQVQAQGITAIMPFDTSLYPRNRLGLAKWTVSKKNPITARVFVNQIWQEFFGRGIVKTSGDFGMQGERPSHPELLDWLAVDFMEHNWDIKYLVNKIVTSATYRQSAKINDNKDPDNVYLARSGRNRFNAEFVRDMLLTSSGLLVKTIGGPSVKPYQPKGLWEGATSGRGELAKYTQDKGNDLYRRGMYTFIKLTVPPPSMILFDASNRDQCEVIRSKTNTPLQALIMMNDPTVLEASRVFAQKLLSQKIEIDKKLEIAFRTIICRKSSSKEFSIIRDYYKEQLDLFNQNKLNANNTINIGAYPMSSGLNVQQLAALSKTICLIYNMEEAITKT